jgi:hypothetical protein
VAVCRELKRVPFDADRVPSSREHRGCRHGPSIDRPEASGPRTSVWLRPGAGIRACAVEEGLGGKEGGALVNKELQAGQKASCLIVSNNVKLLALGCARCLPALASSRAWHADKPKPRRKRERMPTPSTERL